MKTLLLIHANCYDVQIFEIVCKTVVLMTVIIAVFYFFVHLSRIILDWKKSKLTTDNDVKSANGKTSDTKNEERKFEMQRQDRAKAIVKDFYEATKDLTKAGELMKMYEVVLRFNSNSTNVDSDGKE